MRRKEINAHITPGYKNGRCIFLLRFSFCGAKETIMIQRPDKIKSCDENSAY
jgi:hypothetical protein